MKKQLTPKSLKALGFLDNGRCGFDGFENMNYWVREGVCLFYNIPVDKNNQASYYVGYATMNLGIYRAVAFRWISTTKELMAIYKSVTGLSFKK